jgi:hypothetical protein
MPDRRLLVQPPVLFFVASPEFVLGSAYSVIQHRQTELGRRIYRYKDIAPAEHGSDCRPRPAAAHARQDKGKV